MSRPEDISYAAAGYAPLLVRVVQLLLKQEGQRSGNLEAMKLMPGPFIEINQPEHAMELQAIIAK